MTRAADRAMYDDYRAGKFKTHQQVLQAHIGTIDHADELEAFRLGCKSAGADTDEVKAAIYRRQKQIGAKA